MRSRPNIIFCNLQNSGSSAIDPILREIFSKNGYFITPYGPEGTARLKVELGSSQLPEPFYHWTHDPVETFVGMIGAQNYRFIYLHRDPRDAAVSWAHDFQNNGVCGDTPYSLILEMVITHNLPPHVRAAMGWVRSDCLVITFQEIKSDIAHVLNKVLNFVGYFDASAGDVLQPSEIEEIIHKYSFESLTGRSRGEGGQIVRTAYMLRKGISGEWKKHFDNALIQKCNETMGQEIIALGYEPAEVGENQLFCADMDVTEINQALTLNQIDSETIYHLVSPPFSCGVAWLVNALLHLNIKLTNHGFESNHWQENGENWQISDKAATHLKWHLPVLHDRQLFAFPEAKEVLWEHRLDFADFRLCPTILFVRDPRDAIYSLYCRNYMQNMGFDSYLNRPDEWPDHFPGLFQLPPLETFAYFYWFWKSMGEVMPLKIVRFEDVKESPIIVLKEVLAFLRVERTDLQIQAAVESSSLKNARRAMVNMEKLTGKEFKTVRKAQIGEWKNEYSLIAKLRIGKIVNVLLSELNYSDLNSNKSQLAFSSDTKILVSKIIPEKMQAEIANYLLLTMNGQPPNSSKVANYIVAGNISGFQLLKLASIVEAIYYVEKIFIDTSSPQAKVALNTFVNLNLHFINQWPIQVAAWFCLKRIEAQSGIPLISRIGIYWRVKQKISRYLTGKLI